MISVLSLSAVLAAGLCTDVHLEVNAASASRNVVHAYIICQDGRIAHYVDFKRNDELQISGLARNIVRDADLSKNGNTIAVAVTADPPLRFISTRPLSESRHFDDAELFPEIHGNVMPVFSLWLTDSALLYEDERTGYPLILDTTQGFSYSAEGFPVSCKDQVIVASGGNLILSLRYGEVHVYDVSKSSLLFSERFFPRGQYWWETDVGVRWSLSILDISYARAIDVPGESIPVEASIDWKLGKVQKVNGTVPDAVARVLASRRGREFVMAYARGRGRSGNAYPIVHGPLREAIKIVNAASFSNLPDNPQQAYLTPDGKAAAIVHFKRGEEQGPERSAIRFVDLRTGGLLHELMIEQEITAVLFHRDM